MALYRVSGTVNISKGVNYPYFIPNVFYDHDSAADAAKTYIENVIKKHSDKDVYKASIEGRKVLFYGSYDAIDTFSAVSSENVIMSLSVFPIKEYTSGANCLYTYRDYDIIENSDEMWNIMSSGFMFGIVSKGNIEAALQHIDHLIFESNLQVDNNVEEE